MTLPWTDAIDAGQERDVDDVICRWACNAHSRSPSSVISGLHHPPLQRGRLRPQASAALGGVASSLRTPSPARRMPAPPSVSSGELTRTARRGSDLPAEQAS